MEFVGEASTEAAAAPAAGKEKKKASKQVVATERPEWPTEVPRPAAPRFPRALSADRFSDASEPRFGDASEARFGCDTRPQPNLVFTNGHATASQGRPLSPRLHLPPVVHFYVRVKFQKVAFPFPPSISTKQYLHEAPLRSAGGELASITLPFDERHVIGLQKHQMQSFCQLVVEVPSAATVGKRLRQRSSRKQARRAPPTRLRAYRRKDSQAHTRTS